MIEFHVAGVVAHFLYRKAAVLEGGVPEGANVTLFPGDEVDGGVGQHFGEEVVAVNAAVDDES